MEKKIERKDEPIKSGELADSELDAVAGGGCGEDSPTRREVFPQSACETGRYEFAFVVVERVTELGIECLRKDHKKERWDWFHISGDTTWGELCGSCVHLEFDEQGKGYCGLE